MNCVVGKGLMDGGEWRDLVTVKGGRGSTLTLFSALLIHWVFQMIFPLSVLFLLKTLAFKSKLKDKSFAINIRQQINTSK